MFIKNVIEEKNRNKIYLLMPFLLVIIVVCFGCASDEIQHSSSQSADIQYAFPLSSEDIESVLESEELSWEITDSRTLTEGNIVYTLEDKSDKIFSFLSSYSINGIRFLALNFFSGAPLSSKELSEPIDINKWNDMIKLAGIFYGNTKNTEQVYKELNDYLENRDSNIYGRAIWSKEIDGIHYMIQLQPSKKSNSQYIIQSIFIMNYDAIEGYSKILVNGWRQRMINEDVEILENITVSEIESIRKRDSNTVKGLIIKGSLENIKKARKKDLPSVAYPNKDLLAYKNDYFRATLVDKTGSIKIIVRLTSLSEKELSQERIHYITYFIDDNVCVIDKSVLIEQEESD